jgi:pristinamycin I synthase 3 and 4
MAMSLRDDSGVPTPAGSVGEIWISGPGVARGYFKDDEATARAFRMESWGPGDDRWTYISGDLARAGADGEFFYVGRRDDQVKIRGYRIELGEVTAALKSHPDVIDAYVATDTGESVGSRLLAWASVRSDGTEANDLKEFLAGRLPPHMVPNDLRILDRLPLTPNGKVDRRSLLAPVAPPPDGSGRAGRASPRDGSREAAIARIWAEELGIADVAATDDLYDIAPTDDFFDLGGHSLLVIKVVRRVRAELGVDLPARALYEAPRFVEFVDTVRARSTH